MIDLLVNFLHHTSPVDMPIESPKICSTVIKRIFGFSEIDPANQAIGSLRDHIAL